jgi:hypothetical protein
VIPWSPAAATSVGSFPGTDIRETVRIVRGEIPDFLHLPELPARGPGSDLIGRTLAVLSGVDHGFSAATTPTGWRIDGADTSVMRRGRSWLGEDLDALEEVTQGYVGPMKIQLCGPWTLAASVEGAGGERLVRDPGAVREIAEGLAEAARVHVADVRRRIPESHAVLQWDEPLLPAVMAGQVRTASGLATYRSVDLPVVSRVLTAVMAAVDDAMSGVHCCAQDAPVALLVECGAQFLSIDILDARPADAEVAAAWESGVGILLGCVRSRGGTGRATDEVTSRAARRYLADLGFADDRYLRELAITPSCGLAGADPAWVRSALAACRTIGVVLRDDRAGVEE